MGLDDYCGGPFWNLSLTWNTTDPEFTKCFEKTALVWVPSIFLCIFSPAEIHYILNSKTRNVPWNWRNISKLGITATLTLLMVAELITVFQLSSRGAIIYDVDFYTPVIKGITLIWSGVLIFYNRKYGMMTSGLLFLFWLLMAICGIPQFRTEIRESQNDNVLPEFYGIHLISLIYYILVVIMFLLNCLSDKLPKETLYVKSQNPCPELTASFLSKLVFAWFDGLIIQGYKKPLEQEDLWDISPKYSSKEIVPVFEGHWKYSVKKSKENGKKASFVPALFKTFGAMFFFGAFYRLVNDLLIFVNPNILGWLINFVKNKEEAWKGILYACLLFITATFQSFFLQQFSNRNLIISMRIRSALISLIYKKSLVISNNARKESTVGEIVNLMSIDTNRFGDVGNTINILWSAPLQICLSVYFLWQELGPSVLAGLAVMVLLFPINALIANRMKKLHMKNMKNKDERVKLMNEILSGIRILKLYAWEKSFGEQVMKVRTREINNIKRSRYLQAFAAFIMTCTPFMVALASFTTYVLIDEKNILDANKAFVSLSLFNIIRGPLQQLPQLITSFLQMWVSVNRINNFLNAEEIDPDNVHHTANIEYPITIEKGTFTWDDTPVLNDINLKVQANTLTAIVGNVGSGKSSLLCAILGETIKVNGQVNTYGNIAYLSQQAWIQNATLKDNILFGQPFDKDRYNRIIEACALKTDFTILPAGDETEIGEKGINLSGGQKQRVSLARAIYINADIYLLDDPLSAVDSHVGKHIFDNVIGPTGLLSQKTRLLVTHALTYLPQTDQISVMKDGYISESGTYQELLNRKGDFSEFLLQYVSSGTVNEEELRELKTQLSETPIGDEIQKRMSDRKSLPNAEDKETEPSVNGFMDGGFGDRSGGRGRGTGSSDGRGRGAPRGGRGRGGPPGSGGRGGTQGSRGGGFPGGRGRGGPQRGRAGGGRGGANGIEMKDIRSKPDGKLIEKEKAETGNVKLGIYKYYIQNIGYHMIIIIFGFQLLTQAFGIGSNGWLGQWSDDDTIVVDGVVNTVKRDMYLGVYGAIGFGQAFTIIGSNVIYAIATLAAATKIHNCLLEKTLRLPMTFFDVTPVGRILGRFSSDISGVDSMLPGTFQNVLSNILRVLGTLVVIIYSTPLFVSVIVPLFIIYYLIQRLYIASSRQLRRLVSVSRSPIFTHFGETLTGLQIIRAYGQEDKFVLECHNRIDQNQKCHFPQMTSQRWLAIRLEIIGNLIILFAALFAVLAKDQSPALVGLSITYSMQITQNLKMLVNLATSVETNLVSVERIREYQENEPEAAWEPANVVESWPQNGSIKFKNYCVRYREGLDLVLKDLNVSIEAGMKIGIVGRTGAGKSSITLGLFRLIEAAEGKILIDNVDIAQIGLQKLRSSLTIIPQDPALFAGSLRINLDPFAQHSDEELWRVLELAHLKHFVKGLPAGLQHEIIEGGANLSVGQKQLVCLARALLRKTKILILDEATAAVDLETDDLIQKTIRTEFAECTVLTIAHRLNTVMNSDRILVLDKGKIVEFDTPANLTANTASIFYGMYKNTRLSS